MMMNGGGMQMMMRPLPIGELLGGGLGPSSMSSWGGMYFLPLFPHDELEIAALKEQKDEDCRLYGHFDVSRVPGDFHIGLHSVSHDSWEQVYGETRYGPNDNKE